MRNSLIILVALLGLPAVANAGWCQHTKDLSKEIRVAAVRRIEVLAVSGDLRITGHASPGELRAKGRACVQEPFKDRLGEIAIIEERDGDTLRIIAVVPFADENEESSRIGGLDLTLTIPHHLPLRVSDSSGHIEIDGVHSVTLNDSSGDVRINNVAATVHVERDSSGDLDIRDAGEVIIDQDTSGGIDVRRSGSLAIGRDSSGVITARDIRGDVTVGSDSSGSIEVFDVAGAFSVKRDTSGGIDYERVGGPVQIPADH